MDTPAESELDELVALAAAICGTPIALVSLVDESRQWFKARVGLEARETPRDLAFCARAIEATDPGLFTVRDARTDPRFQDNPLVLGKPNVVFYAGAPLLVENGLKLGTLCVIDHEPRTLTPLQEKTLVTLSNVVVRHLQLSRAVTERSRLLEEARIAQEVAERANRTMDEFLATVSHELRTPLNAMLGWTRLLRGDGVPESKRAKALETIERNATAQAQLIEDLLDVSRIISGKMKLEVGAVAIDTVIERALEVVRLGAEVKNVSLDVSLDPAANEVIGDAARLQQVVWNLLANAVKFTPKGGRIAVSLTRVGDAAQLAVTDSGSGIAPEFLRHVFDRFKQADSASTRAHGGLGLGLAIVKNIVELHGGTVAAHSDGLGTGSTFTVLLPLASPQAIPSRAPSGDEATYSLAPKSELDGLRILVVDDEPDARELLAAVLEQGGADVRTAGSAMEALVALAEYRPSVLVSDIGMPIEDGYSLIRRIRKLSPDQGGRVRAVALTAFARTEDRTRALRAGFDMHLPKPVEAAELLAVIVSLVERVSEI
ncbi:MAG: signal transduction histidine kinase [Labilithrix sp.]|nr:signal transduction histidine kinase [Labilithrix sp.]